MQDSAGGFLHYASQYQKGPELREEKSFFPFYFFETGFVDPY